MRINNVQNNTPSFNGFYLNTHGAQELAEKFGKNAKKFSEQEYSPEKYYKKIEKIYKKILGGK